MRNIIYLDTENSKFSVCQEPCAKAQDVLGFLSTFKNAKIQRAFLMSKKLIR